MGKGKKVLLLFERENRRMLIVGKEEHQKNQGAGERGKGERKVRWRRQQRE